jgi:death on curing protein
MRYLTLSEVWKIHNLVVEHVGGSYGLLYRIQLEISLDRPLMQSNGIDKYPTLVDKAAALWFYIGISEPFADLNQVTAYAVMESLLVLNSYKINASIDEKKKIVLELAEGNLTKEKLAEWLKCHVQQKGE